MSKFHEHYTRALDNLTKPTAKLAVGDFVLTSNGDSKFCGDLVRHAGCEADAGHRRLCLITRIEEVRDGALLDRNAIANWKPCGKEGGWRSDDVQGKHPAYITNEEYETFHHLAVLVREQTTGRCVLIDPNGEDGPTYVFFRRGFEEPFAPMVGLAKAEAAMEAAKKALEDADAELRHAISICMEAK